MRALPFALALLALPAGAEDIPLRADVVAATVYPAGATLRREARGELPPGRHRLVVPWTGAVPDATVEGATLLGSALLPDAALPEGALDTPAQAGARAALERAERRTREARRAVAGARGVLDGAETRLRWIATLTGGEGGALPGPRGGEALAGLLDTLDGATRDAVADRVAAEGAVDEARDALREAEEAEARARAALRRLAPLPDGGPALALTVDGPGGAVAASIESFEPAAGWTPRYDLALDTRGPTLTLDRMVEVTQATGAAWEDVALRLATDRPAARAEPTEPLPDPARTFPPFAAEADASLLRESEPMPMDLGAATVAPVARPEIRGLAVSYDYPEPVTLRPGATALLALDTVAMEVDTELRAVPRHDATAFLVATARNPTAEPILPGPAALIRDGARVGEAALPLVAPGAEQEIGFGPMETVRLRWRRLERGEGDRGVFRRADTLREAVAFEVENTGREARDVLALYALPFSEQEEVDVETRADPEPPIRDWEGRRGVAGWTLALAPGETRRVEIDILVEWPEGEALAWQP